MSLFYGSAHVALGNYPDKLGGGITMASQLIERYVDQVINLNLLEILQRLLVETIYRFSKICETLTKNMSAFC